LTTKSTDHSFSKFSSGITTTTTTTILWPFTGLPVLAHLAGNPSWEMEDSVGAKFHSLHALAEDKYSD